MNLIDPTEERISNLQDKKLEIIQSKKQEEKTMKINEDSLQELWDNKKEQFTCDDIQGIRR